MINDNLREIRKKRGLSSKTVAQNINVSITIYRNWENGITSVPCEYLMPLCRELNVSVDYLLNYNKMSMEEYTEKYNATMGVINAMERNKTNKEFILWLFNQSDVDVNGLVLFSVAYALIVPRFRRHLSAIVWSTFRDAFMLSHVTDKKIAEKLIKSESDYMRLWHILDDKSKF